ncbi:MAG: Carb-bd dom fam9 protein [Bacteroidota bacterium]|nr:Carb-bd dom fam9 protein [Bacteroidota bacterium]
MKKSFIIIASILLLISFKAFAQSGMKFAEFAQRLEPYYDKELIDDLKKQLPQGSDFSIWGWDVGDFSGDGFFDVACAVRLTGDKKKTVYVYMFVDMEGFLTKVGQFPYEYFEMPLEIGIAIKNGNCYVTRKRKQFDWLIRGYTFDNGSLIILDEYSTVPIDRITEETYKNYQTLQNSVKYLQTTSGKELFKAKYMTIPCYQRGRQIFKGYASETYDNFIDFVYRGAYYWDGDNDASFSVSSAYDNDYLYLTVYVRDDKLIIQNCDTCICDNVEAWFDISGYSKGENRFMYKDKGSLVFRTVADTGIYCFSVYPGDFLENKSFVRISTTDEIVSDLKESAKKVKSVSSLKKDGYVVKFKIPFEIFGFSQVPLDDNKLTKLGCTIVVHDFDNEFRPEEETIIATSNFNSLNPSTYGEMVFVPAEKWYGETINIYLEEIIKNLTEFGF